MKTLTLILLACLLAVAPLQAKTCSASGGSKTTDFTINAGARGVLFVFSSDFSGTISGVTWSGATDAYYQPPIQPGDTFAAIAVTVAAGTVRYVVTR